jgi:hypothetical protein
MTKQGIRKSGMIGYIRVWTDRQGPSEPTYKTQRTAILAESQRREMPLLYFFVDRGPQRLPDRYIVGGTPDRYYIWGGWPDGGLTRALEALADGCGTVLAVTDFERLGDLAATVLLRAKLQGWELVAFDTMEKPPPKEAVRWASLSSDEKRQRISQRPTDALVHRRNQGVRLGRPPSLSIGVVEDIVEAYASGLGWSAIARIMNDRDVPTAQGGRRWYPSTVRAVVLGQRVR